MIKRGICVVQASAGVVVDAAMSSRDVVRLMACASLVVGGVLVGCNGDPGDDEAPRDLTSVQSAAPRAPVHLGLVDTFAGLPIARPIMMRQPPGDRSTFYIAEQSGKIYRAHTHASQAELVLDLSQHAADAGASEDVTGLLGMDLSPRWRHDRSAYIYYTSASSSAPSGIRVNVARIALRGDGKFEQPQRPLVAVDMPGAQSLGGHTLFGPDGQLYVGIGDGGQGESGAARDPRGLLGTIVRIDVDSRAPEVYAQGFRNPWRFSFDRGTRTLWLGDPGAARYEEIDRVLPGGNYGWSACEGAHRFDPKNPNDPNSGLCGEPDVVSPVLEYTHEELGGGAAIIGGFVYRGSAIAGLVGSYVFGDFVHGTIWRLVTDSAGKVGKEVVLQTGDNVIASFSEDLDGELYVLQLDGRILKIVAR